MSRRRRTHQRRVCMPFEHLADYAEQILEQVSSVAVGRDAELTRASRIYMQGTSGRLTARLVYRAGGDTIALTVRNIRLVGV